MFVVLAVWLNTQLDFSLSLALFSRKMGVYSLKF